MRKSQTATEYLIILAVVIIIALLVVNVIGGVPQMGSRLTSQVGDTTLTLLPIGVINYAIRDVDTIVIFRNNKPSIVSIDNFTVDDITCEDSDGVVSFKMHANVQESVVCTNINRSNADAFDIVINWVDLDSNASYRTANDAPV